MWPTKLLLTLSLALASISTLGGCRSADEDPGPLEAAALIEGRSGSALRGLATFREGPGGLRIELELLDAPPGLHGVHVAVGSECSWPDARTAGGHFNPDRMGHGAPGPHAHAGDLGNVEVGSSGAGHLELVSERLTLAPGPRSILGRTIVVCERSDDFKTQPDGDGGVRLGCGAIILGVEDR